MAIVTEHYKTRADGVELVRTYSDTNCLIERDGIQYSEAIDPANLNRTYTEVPGTEQELTDSEALAIIMGGATNA